MSAMKAKAEDAATSAKATAGEKVRAPCDTHGSVNSASITAEEFDEYLSYERH
jgi:hypothetical protein